jgi:hypothetical protein
MDKAEKFFSRLLRGLRLGAALCVVWSMFLRVSGHRRLRFLAPFDRAWCSTVFLGTPLLFFTASLGCRAVASSCAVVYGSSTVLVELDECILGLFIIRRGSGSSRFILGVSWLTRSSIRRRVTGLTTEWSRKIVLGISDKSTVKLDFDGVPFKTVKYWAERACRWFKLEGFIILKSSEKHYHVVFNRPVTWVKNVHIMNWVAMESQISKLDYALMQGIKESSTLRVGPKGEKPSPRIVYCAGKKKGEIYNYLKKREEIKCNIKKFARARSPLEG